MTGSATNNQQVIQFLISFGTAAWLVISKDCSIAEVVAESFFKTMRHYFSSFSYNHPASGINQLTLCFYLCQLVQNAADEIETNQTIVAFQLQKVKYTCTHD